MARWLCVFSLVGVVPSILAGSPQADVSTLSGQIWRGVLVGRTEQGGVVIRVEDVDGETVVSQRDIESIRFDPEYRERNIEELIADGYHQQAADQLETLLAAVVSFGDLPTDLARWRRQFRDELVQAGQYDRLREWGKQWPTRSGTGDRLEGVLCQALAECGLGLFDEAEVRLDRLAKVDWGAELTGLHDYARGILQLHQHDYHAARQTAARMITFSAKDLDWWAAGLYLSARAHLGLGATRAAADTLEEILVVAPASRWGKAATRLQVQLASQLPSVDQHGNKEDQPGSSAPDQPRAVTRTPSQ